MQLKNILLATFVLLAASCTRYRNIVYLQQDKGATDTLNLYPYQVPVYRIQARDILYIRILSMNKEVTELINTSPTFTTNIYTNDASFYIYGYNVNDSGDVEIPVIGKVNVVGKTLEEAKESIKLQTAKFLKDPTIIVKLISFKIAVIGEVTRPGTYQNYNNQLTVLEAISMAGDITAFGNRQKIMVIRPDTGGTKLLRLNLTSNSILKSEGFYLLPNDIVYVEPVKSKNFRNNVPTMTLTLGAISTFILVLNYINSNSKNP
ncbi:MAG: polysaccharide export protein [Bacteroidales bacterium]|nr:polysaccharide export protein [Bacteroidales bacterium]